MLRTNFDGFLTTKNLLQLLADKGSFVDSHRRSLEADEKEIAYLVVSRGTGTSANTDASRELKNADQGTTELDLSEPIWWVDRDFIKAQLRDEGKKGSFLNQVKYMHEHMSFEKGKHRRAMTIPPIDGLLKMQDTLTSLNLAHHSLLDLPEPFFELKLLEHLDLTNNCLLSISPFIARLSRLRILKISHNLLLKQK